MTGDPITDRRTNRDSRTPPQVFLRCGQENEPCLPEIRAGLEEEGVPLRVEHAGRGSAPGLAFKAAQASPLDVGIGIDAAGNICVHHAKLPENSPVLAGPRAHARLFGHNAARLVIGIPLKPLQAARSEQSQSEESS